MKQGRSIRHKLLRVILLTSASVLILTFAFFFAYEVISYRQITLRQLNTLSTVIASNSTGALAFQNPEDAHEILFALKAVPNITAACIYTTDGNIFARYPDSATGLPAAPAADGFNLSSNFIQGFVPVEQDGVRLGTLFIKRDMKDLYARILFYSVIAIIVMGASFLFVYLLSRQLQKGISAPIIALSETTKQVAAANDYSLRAVRHSDDEIGTLTETFNKMLSQIEIQNREIEGARQAALQHATELEIKVAERTTEYKRQKEFAETVIESSLVLITVFDLETRILAYNKKCEEEFGIKAADVIGRSYVDAFPGVRNTLSHTSLHRALQGEVIHNAQYRSGITGHYYESYMVPLRNESGDVYAVLMTAHNITKIVESSEQLRNNNLILQHKNAELEQFAYIASHDLQEPLRKIRTFISIIERNIGNPEMIQKHIAKTELAAERMTLLVKDVLEYSRLSHPRENFAPVDLNVVLENVKLDFELLILQREAKISSNMLPVLPGNALQLQQLFANLIHNAIKFSLQKPEITITCSNVDEMQVRANADLNPEQRYYELTFSDNGIGFDQKYDEKIFGIFQRLNTRDKYEGTGIGLALCKRIVNNHGGLIRVHSVPDQGTTFTILLPHAG